MMTKKPFLKIHNDFFIQYGDEGELFSMHKPSDIRSLMKILNRQNGYSELQCEYNDLEMGEEMINIHENNKERFRIDYENKTVIDNKGYCGKKKITALEELVDKLNELEYLKEYIREQKIRFAKLLNENTKPTTRDGGRDVYLTLDDTKQCKYEKTFICDKCAYFSSYFLDCRLMMGDDQYKKALSLGLVKE